MLIAAFIIASLFPPYTQPVISTQLVPGIVSGQCVAAGTGIYLIGVACGGGGGGSNFPTGITTGIPGTDGPFAVVASAHGPVGFTTSSTTCLPANSTCGSDLLITDPIAGPVVAIDTGGNIEAAGTIAADSGLLVGNSSTGADVLILTSTSGGLIDFQGATGTQCSSGSLCMQYAGPPTGPCSTGAIYTNANAVSLTTVLYVCEASTWHAVTIP
jgi:hypothetical protein